MSSVKNEWVYNFTHHYILFFLSHLQDQSIPNAFQQFAVFLKQEEILQFRYIRSLTTQYVSAPPCMWCSRCIKRRGILSNMKHLALHLFSVQLSPLKSHLRSIGRGDGRGRGVATPQVSKSLNYLFYKNDLLLTMEHSGHN